jgi:HSP20 family protein
MARDTGHHERDENPRQGAGQSFAKPDDASAQAKSAADMGSATAERGDRERSIQTNRERGNSADMVRRQTSTPVYGGFPGMSVSPFTVMRRMADDMDRLFENFGFGRPGFGLASGFGTGMDRELWRDIPSLEQPAWSPQVETFRRGDQLVVRADLPGLQKDDLKVEIDDGVLTISGERSEEHEDDRDNYYRSERSYGQFYRAIPLPTGVTGEQSEASFKDGVLEVTLPAPQEKGSRVKQIPVR